MILEVSSMASKITNINMFGKICVRWRISVDKIKSVRMNQM